MDNRLSHEELQKLIRSNMGYDRNYTDNDIWYIYTEIMNRDSFIGKYIKMEEGSLRRRLADWSSSYTSWLICTQKDNRRIYSLREPDMCCIMTERYKSAWQAVLEFKEKIKRHR